MRALLLPLAVLLSMVSLSASAATASSSLSNSASVPSECRFNTIPAISVKYDPLGANGSGKADAVASVAYLSVSCSDATNATIGFTSPDFRCGAGTSYQWRMGLSTLPTFTIAYNMQVKYGNSWMAATCSAGSAWAISVFQAGSDSYERLIPIQVSIPAGQTTARSGTYLGEVILKLQF